MEREVTKRLTGEKSLIESFVTQKGDLAVGHPKQDMCSSLDFQGCAVAVASRTGKLRGSLCVSNREKSA